MQDMKSGPPCDTRRTQQTAAVAPRYAGGASQEKTLGYTLRISLAFMVGMLPMELIQAHSGQGELPRASLQRAEQMAQMRVPGTSAPSANSAPAGPAPATSSENNYKWLIKSSGEDYKWAIPAADKSAASENPLAPSEAKPERG